MSFRQVSKAKQVWVFSLSLSTDFKFTSTIRPRIVFSFSSWASLTAVVFRNFCNLIDKRELWGWYGSCLYHSAFTSPPPSSTSTLCLFFFQNFAMGAKMCSGMSTFLKPEGVNEGRTLGCTKLSESRLARLKARASSKKRCSRNSCVHSQKLLWTTALIRELHLEI